MWSTGLKYDLVLWNIVRNATVQYETVAFSNPLNCTIILRTFERQLWIVVKFSVRNNSLTAINSFCKSTFLKIHNSIKDSEQLQCFLKIYKQLEEETLLDVGCT